MSCWQDVEFLTFYILIAYRTYYPTEKTPVFWDTWEYSVRKRDCISVRKGTEPKISELDPKEDVYYREWRAEIEKKWSIFFK